MAKDYEKSLLENPSKRILTKAVCLALCLALVLGTIGFFTSSSYEALTNYYYYYNSVSLPHVCGDAHDPISCLSIVSEVASNGALRKGDTRPLKTLIGKSMINVESAMKKASDMHYRVNDPKQQVMLDVCMDLLDMSMNRLRDSLQTLENGNLDSYSDVHVWLSGVLTNYFTCLDELDGAARSLMETGLNDLIARGRASLAVLVALPPKQPDFLKQIVSDKFPAWVTNKDRKLLEASSPQAINPNVVVAKDGSGKFKTVSEAVASAPDKSSSRYVIYVKKGTYKENVQIKKKNIMLVGDGMSSTIITGSLNFIDGTTTYRSATVAVDGDGFIAQDIGFQNTAGPQKHQAVALRVSSDQSVINRCQIDAYQDTLYAHSLRQFYRDCQITGTVDFIFGNAAVVFQDCKIIARKPLANQFNAVTAQGREDPNQNTGTSLQNCQIMASSDLQPVRGSFKSYLGRPWKNYSRTAVLQSDIGDLIDPSGWVLWDQFTNTKAVYYGEYSNRGPGAGTSKRVNWPGFHVITNAAEARKFTVAELIQGKSWLQSTGVTFSEGL